MDNPIEHVADLRVNYKPPAPLTEETIPTKDPLKLFKLWFQDAADCKQILEPNAMTLATADKNGKPSVRVVLLKGFDDSGFKFYTNYNSQKGKELAENPQVALLFYWDQLHKQIRVDGTVSKLSQAENEEYFHSRPHGSQMGARVSHQGQPISSSQVLTDKFEELKEKYPSEKDEVPKPEEWGGYLITPTMLEFWQGQENRLHNRFQFLRKDEKAIDGKILKEAENGWMYRLLSP